MSKREQIKEDLHQLVRDLIDYSKDAEYLLQSMDNLSDEEFDKLSFEIQDKYEKKHIIVLNERGYRLVSSLF